MARMDLVLSAAMASLMAQDPRVFRVRSYGDFYPTRPLPKLRIPSPEKYPGQRRAYLAGAWRPMSAAQIAEHNAGLPTRERRTRWRVRR